MGKNDLKYQFQYVLLFISGTVGHIIKILAVISTGVFLSFLFFVFFKKNASFLIV